MVVIYQEPIKALSDDAFAEVNLSFRIPSSEYHSSILCEFNAHPGNVSHFGCREYIQNGTTWIETNLLSFATVEGKFPNSTDLIGNLPTQPFVESRDPADIETLSFANHHDGMGNYKIEYDHDHGSQFN